MVHVIEESYSEPDRAKYKEINAQLAIENSKKDHIINQAYAENSHLRHKLQGALSSISKKDVEIRRLRMQIEKHKSQNKVQRELLSQIYHPLKNFCENQNVGTSTNDTTLTSASINNTSTSKTANNTRSINNTNNNMSTNSNINNDQRLSHLSQNTDQHETSQLTDEDADCTEYEENSNARDDSDRVDPQERASEENCNQQLNAISERTENPSTDESYDSLVPPDVTAYIPPLRPEYHFGTPSIFNLDDNQNDPKASTSKTLTPDKHNDSLTPNRNTLPGILHFSQLRYDQHSTPVISPTAKGKDNAKRKRAAPELSEKIAQVTTPKRRYNLRSRQ